MHLKSLECFVLLVLAMLHGKGMTYPQSKYASKNAGSWVADGNDNWQEFVESDFNDYNDNSLRGVLGDRREARYRAERGETAKRVKPRYSGNIRNFDELTEAGDLESYGDIGESRKVENFGIFSDGGDVTNLSDDDASQTDLAGIRGYAEPIEYGDLNDLQSWGFANLKEPYDLDSLRDYNDETEKNDLLELKDLGSFTDASSDEDGNNDSSDSQQLSDYNEPSESLGSKIHKRKSALSGGPAIDIDNYLNGLTALLNERNSYLKDVSRTNDGDTLEQLRANQQFSAGRETRNQKDVDGDLGNHFDTHDLGFDEEDEQPKRFAYAPMPLAPEACKLEESMEEAVTPDCDPEDEESSEEASAPQSAPPAAPSKQKSKQPEASSSGKSSEVSTGKSSEASSGKSSEASTAKPSEASTAKPLETSTARPSEASTAKPSVASSGKSSAASSGASPAASSGAPSGASPGASSSGDDKSKELHQLIQHLYIAQARVQMEASEIKKSQVIANAAQANLEEAANHVRSITAELQNAQQEVAAAAIRAQTAQLQLAAHDQLLFAARQDVDALSSQMVGLQAAEGFAAPLVNFDVNALLNKLKEPLPDNEKPTAIPPVCPLPKLPGAGLWRR